MNMTNELLSTFNKALKNGMSTLPKLAKAYVEQYQRMQLFNGIALTVCVVLIAVVAVLIIKHADKLVSKDSFMSIDEKASFVRTIVIFFALIVEAPITYFAMDSFSHYVAPVYSVIHDLTGR
ncbi:MAG: hypothetical protein LBT37_06405 [Lactobacillaceae bacterium]|jgi:cytosine/uracil/thiamine/allantoin permease|nr:hypothetical protein [Lactobacillaceae bacterium]